MNLCGRLQRWSQQVRCRMDVDSRLGAHTRRQHPAGNRWLQGRSQAFRQLVFSESVVRERQEQTQEVSVSWPWGALVEEGNGGLALVERCRRPGWGYHICPIGAACRLLPAPGARGPAYPPAVRGEQARPSPRRRARTPESGRAKSGDRLKGGAAWGRRLEFTIGQERSSESKWEPNRRGGQRREVVAHKPGGRDAPYSGPALITPQSGRSVDTA